MTVEQRLRDAITAHTEQVEPADDAAWERIEARLRPARNGRRLVALAAAVLVLAGAVAVIARDSDLRETRVPLQRSPTPTTPPGHPEWWVWPPQESDRLFDTPRSAALSFAREFLGIEDPVATRSDPEDAMWPSVSVRRRGSGLDMRVITGRRGEHHGFGVRSAQSDGLVVTAPVDFDVLSSPLRPTGETPSEATVLMAMVEDGQTLAGPLSSASFAGGGAMPKLFWGPPSQPMGSFVLTTRSADGTVERATVVRVRLDPKAGRTPDSFLATTTDERLVQLRTTDLNTLKSIGVPEAGSLSSDEPFQAAWVQSGGRLKPIGLYGEFRSDGPGEDCSTGHAHGMSLACVRGNRIGIEDLESASGPHFMSFLRGESPVSIASVLWWTENSLAFVADYADRGELFILDFRTGAESLDDARRVPREDARVYRYLVATDGRLAAYRSDLSGGSPGDVVLIDPVSGAVTTVFEPGFRIVNLDVDASGRHWLFVDDNHVLWRWSGEKVEQVATGIVDAEW